MQSHYDAACKTYVHFVHMLNQTTSQPNSLCHSICLPLLRGSPPARNTCDYTIAIYLYEMLEYYIYVHSAYAPGRLYICILQLYIDMVIPFVLSSTALLVFHVGSEFSSTAKRFGCCCFAACTHPKRISTFVPLIW